MCKNLRLWWLTCVMLFAFWTELCSARVCSAQQDLPMGKGKAEKPLASRLPRRKGKSEKVVGPIIKPPIASTSDAKEMLVYKKLAAKNPLDSSNWASFAYSYYRARRYEEAVDSYRRAIKLKAIDAWCYQLGRALQNLDRDREAVEAFNQALLLNPRFNAARYELALSYFKIGDRKSALAQAEILGGLNAQLADALRAHLKTGRIR